MCRLQEALGAVVTVPLIVVLHLDQNGNNKMKRNLLD